MGHTTLKQSVIRFLESTLEKKYILLTFVLWKSPKNASFCIFIKVLFAMLQTTLDGLHLWKFAFKDINKTILAISKHCGIFSDF